MLEMTGRYVHIAHKPKGSTLVNHTAASSRLTRRSILALTAGLMTAFALPAQAASAWQQVESVQAALAGAEPLEQGVLLDLPLVSENGASVPLTVRVDYPLSEGERIESIELFAPANPDPQIATFHFTALSGTPEVATRVRLNETQTVVALARLSSGQVLVGEREVRVTTSGCLMVDDTYAAENIFQTRLRAPQSLAAGEAGEVLSIINHPMETGLRQDSSGNTLPKRIIERLEATLDGETVFVADLNRSVSANPFVRFHVAPQASGTLDLRWIEDTGERAEAQASISVN